MNELNDPRNVASLSVFFRMRFKKREIGKIEIRQNEFCEPKKNININLLLQNGL